MNVHSLYISLTCSACISSTSHTCFTLCHQSTSYVHCTWHHRVTMIKNTSLKGINFLVSMSATLLLALLMMQILKFVICCFYSSTFMGGFRGMGQNICKLAQYIIAFHIAENSFVDWISWILKEDYLCTQVKLMAL